MAYSVGQELESLPWARDTSLSKIWWALRRSGGMNALGGFIVVGEKREAIVSSGIEGMELSVDKSKFREKFAGGCDN